MVPIVAGFADTLHPVCVGVQAMILVDAAESSWAAPRHMLSSPGRPQPQRVPPRQALTDRLYPSASCEEHVAAL
jgi:hypothetical protein